MAYNGPFDQSQGRPYNGPGGPGGQRPPPQRQYPPGPGGPGGPGGPQSFNGAPQRYDQYQGDYGYERDEYGNAYEQGYGEPQYDDRNYQRGYPPNQNPPPRQDYYGPGPGPNGGGRGGPPMMRGRGGPMRPPGDGGRGGPFPPRGGGMQPVNGRGYAGPGRGGRPGGPMERAGNSDPSKQTSNIFNMLRQAFCRGMCMLTKFARRSKRPERPNQPSHGHGIRRQPLPDVPRDGTKIEF
jgi:hypothetical protein